MQYKKAKDRTRVTQNKIGRPRGSQGRLVPIMHNTQKPDSARQKSYAITKQEIKASVR